MALEQFFGRIVDVTRRTDGDELVAAAAIGATVLYVEDATDFDETGGQVLVGGDVYVYDEVDHDANTLTLTTTLSVASAIGDPVDAFDTELGQIVVEYVAHVLLDDQDIEDDPIEVTVNHALVPMLIESVRGGATETVTLIRDGDDDLVINQVNGKLAEEITADAAVLAAAAAFDEATLALTQVELAIAISDGRINTYYQTAAPWANGLLTHDVDLGDLWYDTDSGTPALAYRWLGKFNRSWVLVDDQSIVQALAAANTAQLTADGKIVHFVGPNPPAAEGYGDIWTESDNDNKKWYWNGVAWMALLAGTGAIADTLTGKVIQTGLSGKRIVVDGPNDIIKFYSGDGSEVSNGYVDPQVSGSGAARVFRLVMTSGSLTAGGEAYIWMDSVNAGNSVGSKIHLVASNGVYLSSHLYMSAFDIDCDTLYGSTSGTHTGSCFGTHNGDVIGNLSGDITGGPAITGGLTVTGTVELNTLDGAGGSSFVMVGEGGILSRGASSSMRYKENVKPLDARVSEALLQVDTITWQYKDRDFHGDRRYAGIPAEQLHDLGLGLFVDYDAEDHPDQVRYWELVAPLIALCQSQQAQIDALTARVEALETP